MHLTLTICVLLFTTITSSLSSDWENFKRDYNKQYVSPAEEAQRKQIFVENVNEIEEYQKTHPDATFTMEINHLTDQRAEELVTGSDLFDNIRSETIEEPIQSKLSLPVWLDWRFRNVTTPVYNQSQVPRVSAIAVVEVIESYQAIQTNALVRGSIDQVNDCCTNNTVIFDCILNKLGGSICSEDAYNSSGTQCDGNVCQSVATFKIIKKLELAKETTMLQWIQDSPLYVAISASERSFLAYKTGIYSEMNCSKTNVDHSLQLVGYGIASGIPYWLCKNSWGTGWGEQGYVRIERGRNMCGIATNVIQIEAQATGNTAVRLVTFHGIYLVLFYFVLHVSFKF